MNIASYDIVTCQVVFDKCIGENPYHEATDKKADGARNESENTDAAFVFLRLGVSVERVIN